MWRAIEEGIPGALSVSRYALFDRDSKSGKDGIDFLISSALNRHGLALDVPGRMDFSGSGLEAAGDHLDHIIILTSFIYAVRGNPIHNSLAKDSP